MLWTNPSPSSYFNPQTINLDLSKYGGVLIETRRYNYDGYPQLAWVYNPKNYTTEMYTGFASIYGGTATQRLFTVNDNGVTFADVQCLTSIGDDQKGIIYVPMRIFGIKEDLSVE